MPEISVLPWNEFLSYVKERKERNLFKDVLILGNEPQLTNWPSVSAVQTLDDLEAVKVQLFTKPLIFQVHCGKHVPVGQRLNNRGRTLGPSDLEWWLLPGSSPWNESTYRPAGLQAQGPRPVQFTDVHFAAVIATSHPSLRRQLDEGFQVAESCIRKKRRFCLQFDFDRVLLDWWLNQGPKDWLRLDCMDTAYCIGARISITNTSEPYHGLDFGVWWTVCLPCYCLLATPYRVWRNLICQIWDYKISVKGNIHSFSTASFLEDLWQH